MPVGPKGEKRPADVIGDAIMVAKIATGEIEETIEDDGKNPAAKALGKKGGTARAKSMKPERRTEIAKKAAQTRWIEAQRDYLLGLIRPLQPPTSAHADWPRACPARSAKA